MKLRLTSDENILAQARRCRSLKKDDHGEVLKLQFDAQVFEFRPGRVVTVNESIGQSLRRESGIIIGEHIDGEQVPMLDDLGAYDINELMESKTPNVAEEFGMSIDDLRKAAKAFQNAEKAVPEDADADVVAATPVRTAPVVRVPSVTR
jgi:hypothetical protein